MSKSLLDILNASEELVSLSKSIKSDKIDPDEVAEPKEKAGDDSNTDNEPKVNNKADSNTDELTEEEKKALESGEYDYKSDEEEGDIEKSNEPNNETENKEDEAEDEEIHEDEALAKSVSNIITAQAEGLKEIGDLAKSLSELKKSMSDKDKLIKSLQDEISSLKSSSVGRKSVGSVGYLEKSFDVSSGLGLSKSEKIETMSKSAKAEILSDALIKGDTSITPLDVLNAEQGIISDAAARVLAKSVK